MKTPESALFHENDNDFIICLIIMDFLLVLLILLRDSGVWLAFQRLLLGCGVLLTVYLGTLILKIQNEEQETAFIVGALIGSCIFYIPFFL